MIVSVLFVGQAPATSQENLRCGSYCLYVALKSLELPVGSYEELESQLGTPDVGGYAMGELAQAAESYGAHTLGVRTSVENLRLREPPFACIAHVDGQHFILLGDVSDSHAWILDPPRDYDLPLDTLRSRWDGKALLIARQPLLPEEDLRRPVGWAWPVTAALLVLASLTTWLLIRRRSSAAA